MDVPLTAKAVEKDNKEYLDIWANGKQNFILSPIKPYFYSKEKVSIPYATETEVMAIALSTYTKTKFYKYEFRTRQALVIARDKIRKIKGDILCEDNIPFVLRCRIDTPDIYTRYPHKKDVKFLWLDIEQYIKPGLLGPLADDRITAISFCFNDRSIKCGYLRKETKTDNVLLKKFLSIGDFKNIDVISLYNKSYDMPTILSRCKEEKIDTSCMSKNDELPTIGGQDGVDIPGICIYDVYDSVAGDQSLIGNVPNKGLKAVSDYHEFKTDVRVLTPKEISELVGTKELIDYNKDDVRRLLYLFDIYYPTVHYKAESLGIPLNLATSLSMTDLGIIVLGDLYREHGIIADGTNAIRHKEIYGREKKTGEPNFQGAIVDIKKTGLFMNVKKADYSSMYPTIGMEFNLGPDTTSIIAYEKYGKFSIKEEDDCYIYKIPDNVLNKNIVIQILKKESFITRRIKQYIDKRSEHKKNYKKTGDKGEKAKSDIYKVFANGAVGYGNHGAAHHPFGFAPMAITIVGIGRQCIFLLIDVLETLYPKSVIEIDTDGVYFNVKDEAAFDKQKVIDMFNKNVEDKFGRTLGLSIDIDEYKRGYFYAMKNYVLDKAGELILHGGALKSSRKCKMINNLIKDIAWAKLKGEKVDDIINHYKHLDFPVEDFAMSVTMGKHPHHYKNKSGFVMSLAKQGEMDYKIPIKKGNQYYYCRTVSGYTLVQRVSENQISKKYYLEEINKVVKLFDVEIKSSINKWI